MREPTSYAIDDADGNPHVYVTSLHPHDPALEIISDLTRMGAGPIVRFFHGGMIAGALEENPGLAEEAASGNINATRIIQSIDVDAMARTFSEGIERIGGLQKLAPKLLRYTSRDGVMLNRPQALDAAFSGNIGEEMQAVKHIWDFNGFQRALVILGLG